MHKNCFAHGYRTDIWITSHVACLSVVTVNNRAEREANTKCTSILTQAHLANVDPQISRALVQANDHIAVNLVLRRNHHHTTALRPSDTEWGCNAAFVSNQRSLVSGFDIPFSDGNK